MVVSLIVVVMAGLDASLRPFKGGNVKRLWRTGYRDAGGQGRRSTCGVPARADICLHAPSCAGCFLTPSEDVSEGDRRSLNAPSCAGCFLTRLPRSFLEPDQPVLIHLLVLGAFWRPRARFS